MTCTWVVVNQVGLVLGCAALVAGCTLHGAGDLRSEATPLAIVDHEGDGSVLRVDHPEHFPLATATRHDAAPALSVTGVVSADVSRNVPVIRWLQCA
jgi:cobalt-zinc-cadmium efflux system membrane fusion protein